MKKSLIARNKNYRYLWIGQTGSMLGDWFNQVALAQTILFLSHSALSVGMLLMCRALHSSNEMVGSHPIFPSSSLRTSFTGRIPGSDPQPRRPFCYPDWDQLGICRRRISNIDPSAWKQSLRSARIRDRNPVCDRWSGSVDRGILFKKIHQGSTPSSRSMVWGFLPYPGIIFCFARSNQHLSNGGFDAVSDEGKFRYHHPP